MGKNSPLFGFSALPNIFAVGLGCDAAPTVVRMLATCNGTVESAGNTVVRNNSDRKLGAGVVVGGKRFEGLDGLLRRYGPQRGHGRQL